MEQITLRGMHAHCDEQGLEVITYDGFDAAIIGLATQGHRDVAVYSYDKLIEVMMTANEWSAEDAEEWYSFNMTGYQDGAPIVMHIEVGDALNRAADKLDAIEHAARTEGAYLTGRGILNILENSDD